MRNIRLILICVIGVFSFAYSATAQQLNWSVDFRSLFDNREGDDSYIDTKTFFQTQLAPEIGVSMDNGLHTISGGVVWTQPIGSKWDGYTIRPTLYYRYNSPIWKFSMGLIPRTQLMQSMPGYLYNDSLTYTNTNIRGALIQYQRKQGFFEFYIDWRGMQSETEREAFNINVHGEWSPKSRMLMLGGFAMMNHMALQKKAPENQHIVDNFMLNPYVGLNLAKVAPLDSFTIKAGPLVELTRNREFDKWESPVGFWGDVTAEYRWLGLKNTLYAGKKLFPYYTQFYSQLNMGEPFYQSSLYNRTTLYAYIVRNSYVNLAASLDFNVTKDAFTFYQRLSLRFYINQSSNKQGKGAYLKNIY